MNNTRFVFEIGSNHNQDIGRVKKLIDSAYELGAWGIKAQLFDPKTLYKDEKNRDILEDRVLPIDFIGLISSYCRQIGLKFGITPFYLDAVDQIEEYVDFYKISSFDILRLDLIEKCLLKEKPVYIACGLASDEDIMNIVKLYNNINNIQELCLMHCVSKYPTKPKESCVSRISEIDDLVFKDIMNGVSLKDGKIIFSEDANNINSCLISVGYSDHTTCPEVIGQAINNGAEIIELHFDLNDLAGAESQYGHVWSESDCKNLFFYIDLIEKISDGEFELTKEDLTLRADPITGMRD